MKRILLFLLIALAIKLPANPSFTIGSNYYRTVFAYPHDIMYWPDQAVFFYFNPQTLPWQGDITDISNRPSESYTNNYQQVEFAPPDGYEGNPNDVRSWMRVSSYAYKKRYTLGGLYTTKFGKVLFEIGNTSIKMELDAEGTGRADEEIGGTTNYFLVPFMAKTYAGRNEYDLKLIYANQLFNIPFGLKFKYQNKTSDSPEGFLKFSKDGQSYELSHLTWGWATVHCNSIFGYSHMNTDAFFQNRYTLFDGYQMDIQASFEIDGNYKSGIRYRNSREDGDTYTWEYDEGSEYTGRYNADPFWKDRRESDLIRAYSKVRFWQIDNLDAGVLFFLQHDSHKATLVNKINESDHSSQESEKEYVIETNPFLNYKFKGGYLDFGLLVELSYTNMDNISERWNSVSHSEQSDVLWNSSPHIGWDVYWERFSKGSFWFFATGFEANTSVSIYKRLSLLLDLTVLRQYTFTEKLYGESEIPEGGNSYQFFQSHRRNSYRNETWMTGSIGISYGMGPVQMLLDMQLPLAYLVKQETALNDNAGQLFEHEKRDMWQVQEPITARLLLVYAFSR